MTEKRIVKFKIADGTPHDSRLARWFSVFCMAVNDVLLANRWLIQGLKDSTPSQNAYLGRLLSAHLFELGTFLKRTDKDHLPEVRDFLAGLEPEPRESLEMLKAVGGGGTSEFAVQLKNARDKIFHYQRLIISDGEDHDPIKAALRGLTRKESKEEIGAERLRVQAGRDSDARERMPRLVKAESVKSSVFPAFIDAAAQNPRIGGPCRVVGAGEQQARERGRQPPAGVGRKRP